MVLNSLKFRMIISVTGIVAISLAVIIFFFAQSAKHELSNALDANALGLLEATKKHVESQYNSIVYHKYAILERRKKEMKNNTIVATAIIESAYRKFKSGQITETEAKKTAIFDLSKLVYDDGVGYFWINDTTRPYPKMIMHPFIPELDGTILSDPKFNCAFGKKENLFKAFVDICLKYGDGYVDYLWPKPLPGGLSEKQPKVSYVKLFKPWNWVIGTGVYIDDIEKEGQRRIKAVIEDLNKTLVKQRIGECGYFFIFTEDSTVLVHPQLKGKKFNNYINPSTGNPIYNDMKTVALNTNNSMEYLWDKPGHEGDYSYPKKAYIDYYEPLGWYIGSSVYKEDFEKKISVLSRKMILLAVFFLSIAVVVSFLVSGSIVNPLNNFIASLKKTDDDGLPVENVPETGLSEIVLLGATMNNMISTIGQSRTSLLQAQNYINDIINSMPSAIVSVDRVGIITQWNKVVEKTTGVDADNARGKNLYEVFPRMISYKDKILESINSKKIIQDRKRQHRNVGISRFEDVVIFPLLTNCVEGAVIRVDDVTEKVQLEEMMIQNEKMLSVGGLASGMAHEINNPLAGMMQTATVMANRLGKDSDRSANKKAAIEAGLTLESVSKYMESRGILRMIDTINESGNRIAEIVSNMLSFARKSEAAFSSHDISGLIDKTLELAATDYDLKKHYDFKTIEIVREYDENMPLVSCEGSKIQQVLLNVFKNGAQAMQTVDEKISRFIIRTRYERIDEMSVVEIEDNGPGIKEEICKRVFEPFFTTKPEGVGVGLGLSVSYFIITENHSGEMLVESQPGIMTKFVIKIPVERK